MLHLGIVNGEDGLFFDELAAHVDGGGFTGVVGVLFEGKAEDGDAFAADGVVEGLHDAISEAALLPLVHGDDGFPVVGDLGKAEVAAEIDEIKNVFLEAGAAETDRGLEEFGSDAGVGADGVRHFVDVGSGRFAEGGDAVDGGNPLGEEGIGDELASSDDQRLVLRMRSSGTQVA